MLSPSAKRLVRDTVKRFNRLYNPQPGRHISGDIVDKHMELIKRRGWDGVIDIFSEYRHITQQYSKPGLRRSLKVIVRIVYGNVFWWDVDFCRDCDTGIWTMCECSGCTSTTFPGWVNHRTGKFIEPTNKMLIGILRPYFDEADTLEAMVDIVRYRGLQTLQASVLSWVSRNYKDISYSLKAKTQLGARSRLSNLSIGHSELSDGQLLMAVSISKELKLETAR